MNRTWNIWLFCLFVEKIETRIQTYHHILELAVLNEMCLRHEFIYGRRTGNIGSGKAT